MVKAGKFPAPKPYGLRRTAWLKSDIELVAHRRPVGLTMRADKHRATLDVLASIGLPACTRVSKRKLAAALAALEPARRSVVADRLGEAGLTHMTSRNRTVAHD